MAPSPLVGYATTSFQCGTFSSSTITVRLFVRGYTSAATRPITDAEMSFTVFLSNGSTEVATSSLGAPLAGLTGVPMNYVPGVGYVGLVPGTAGLTDGSALTSLSKSQTTTTAGKHGIRQHYA